MFRANQMVMIMMPANCDCGKTVWCFFKNQQEHDSYVCSCGLKMGEKKPVVSSFELMIRQVKYDDRED